MEFKEKLIFGMIHLAPGAGGDRVKKALQEIEIYKSEGVYGIIVENYHGSPDDVAEVMWEIDTDEIVTGINILPNEFEKALELADKYDADFIQLDYVSGLYNGRSGVVSLDEDKYLKTREKCPYIKILGGVWPKYYEPVKDSDLNKDIKKGIELSDAVVVTGAGTGKETPLDKIEKFRTICGDHPLIIGAGMDTSNAFEQLKHADGAIVGSCFKRFKKTTEPVDRILVREFMAEVNKHKQ